MKKAIQFGAGNIGRGFIGYLLYKSGYNVTFIDINKEIIDAINLQKKYKIFIKDTKCYEKEVCNIDAISLDDENFLKKTYDAEILTTAIGPLGLKKIAVTISEIIKYRKDKNVNLPLSIIACENMIFATTFLENEILKYVDDSTINYINKFVSFPNCSVDRIVPPIKNENLLDVTVEEFYEWNIEKNAFKSFIPSIYGINLVDNLQAFIERKLFTLNTGHAATAYLGYVKKYKTIDESILDESIQNIVRNTMRESGKAISKKHNFDLDKHFEYIEKIINRFKNHYLQDDICRVGREPIRKLGEKDRFIKPLNTAIFYNVEFDNLLISIASAFNYFNSEDKDSVKIHNDIKVLGLKNTIKNITNINDNNIIQKIILNYENINNII